jgi:hypothetical protein
MRALRHWTLRGYLPGRDLQAVKSVEWMLTAAWVAANDTQTV